MTNCIVRRNYMSLLFLLLTTLSFGQGILIDKNQTVLFGNDSLGPGNKLMWLPTKAAFRAGTLIDNSSNVKTFWDTDSIGLRSVAFGLNNLAKGQSSMVWGEDNKVDNTLGTAWGSFNISRLSSTVWGFGNQSVESQATAWGVNNIADGLRATVWGRDNVAKGLTSTAWGRGNKSLSIYETVLGRYADTTLSPNRFEWEDDDQLFAIGNGKNSSDLNNAFTVLKNGNIGVNTAQPDQLLTLSQDSMPILRFDRSGSGGGGSFFDFEILMKDNSSLTFRGGNNNTGVPNTVLNDVMVLSPTGNLLIAGTLTESSDLLRKEQIIRISYADILAKVRELEITEWQYIGEDIRHLGPMAQDFYAAFGLGADETTIATVDKDGVALASIKALIHENEQLKSKNEELEERLIRIENLLLHRKRNERF